MTSQNVTPSTAVESTPAPSAQTYPTCCQCNATGPQAFGWFKYNDGRDLCGDCRYPVPADACPSCRGAGRYTIGAQTDGLTGDVVSYACPTCRGSGKAPPTTTPDPLPDDWQAFRGLTVRDKNGDRMVWRENGVRTGYFPVGSVLG